MSLWNYIAGDDIFLEPIPVFRFRLRLRERRQNVRHAMSGKVWEWSFHTVENDRRFILGRSLAGCVSRTGELTEAERPD